MLTLQGNQDASRSEKSFGGLRPTQKGVVSPAALKVPAVGQTLLLREQVDRFS